MELNEAYRLAELFDQIYNLGGNLPMLRVWGTQFHAKSDGDLLVCLASLNDRADRIGAEIDEASLSDRSKRLYREALSTLQQFISLPAIFSSTTKGLQNSRQEIDLLFLASDALPQTLEQEVNQLTLDSLVAELEQLIQETGKGDIDATLARLVCVQLSSLIMALRCYPTLGAEGVTKIYGSVAAELARLGNLTPENATKTFLAKAIGAVKKIGAAVVWTGAVATGAHGLITDGSELLGIGGDDADQVYLTVPTE